MLEKAIAITDEIAKRTDEVILFHSASGKDSIALLDICAPRFKRVVCVFMYVVKNMEHINRYINYARKKYPNVEFRVNETDSAGVVSDITEHHADIGFAGTVMGTKNVQYIPFYQDALVLVMPNTQEYIEKSRSTDDYSWLQSEPWLLRSRGSGTQKESERLLTGLGIETERLRVMARFNNTGAILLSIREGTGVAIVSKLAAEAAIERGEVLAGPLGKNGAFRSINMVISSMYPLSESGKKLVHFVKEMYKI
jgi:DNA-binding transcriptional LysR family regulator